MFQETIFRHTHGQEVFPDSSVDKESACMEKEMATHSSTLAWKIPWTKEPGRYNLEKKKKKKNLPAMQETPVQLLGKEDPLEKG